MSFPVFCAGLPSDPSLDTDLHPRRCNQAHHVSRQESAATAVGTEELRVCLPHPGGNPQCARPALQQHLYPVSENGGKKGQNLVFMSCV